MFVKRIPDRDGVSVFILHVVVNMLLIKVAVLAFLVGLFIKL